MTYNETVTNRVIAPKSTSFSWISGEEDGQYVLQGNDGALLIQSVVTNSSETLVAADKVPENSYEYQIKPDMSAVLWATDYTKQYRHSYFANYFIQNVEDGTLTPLAEDQDGDIQYAEWSPVDNTVAYVRGNNLFVWKDGETTQITKNGGPDTFNGVPDWVYEEEIFGGRSALWFSPDGEYLAYLRFNETGVETFTVPYYMDNQDLAPPYPRELEIRYPKVSSTNPTVQFHLLNLASSEETNVPIDAFLADDLIIGEVAWVTDAHDNVVFRAYNRVQDQEKVVLVDVEAGKGKVVRERDGTDGWLDNLMSIAYIGSIKNPKASPRDKYYLDLSDMDGWVHIYLFPVKGGKPIQLTRGQWEVTSIVKIDTDRQLVYFLSTKHHSTERHLYSVSYKNFKMKPLVDDRVAAYWSASFSAKGKYYLLSYQGPDVPYQDLHSIDSKEPIRTITSNADVVHQLKEYRLPKISYFELRLPTGETINVMQRLPANFVPWKKYPVLFTPYGGPNAQEVSKAFQAMDWNAYIASDPELEYVTWTVDNRGTAFKGRKFRSLVAKQLGSLEAEDQVFAARKLAKKPWVDAERMGIWGWSYGGYLTAKVLETDSDAFSFGISTAPVSDFRFYDSMYTERYMKTLETNADGYEKTAVRNTDGFNNLRGSFLIQHGTGDDNVHFQHATVMTNTLMDGGVSPAKLEVQWFTDSDHSIRFENDGTFLYKQLTAKLYEEKHRDFDFIKHQWSRREIE